MSKSVVLFVLVICFVFLNQCANISNRQTIKFGKIHGNFIIEEVASQNWMAADNLPSTIDATVPIEGVPVQLDMLLQRAQGTISANIEVEEVIGTVLFTILNSRNANVDTIGHNKTMFIPSTPNWNWELNTEGEE